MCDGQLWYFISKFWLKPSNSLHDLHKIELNQVKKCIYYYKVIKTINLCFYQGDKTVFTVMLGGAWFESLFGDAPTEDYIQNVALEQVSVAY